MKLTLKAAIKVAGDPSKWEGRCYEIASALAPLAGGTPVYGHWLGPVNPAGYWKDRAEAPFIQHGWIVLPNKNGKYTTDDTIVDPTRWSFEAAEPYIWTGKGEEYDEGGTRFREVYQYSLDDLAETGKQLRLDVGKGLHEHIDQLLGGADFTEEHPYLDSTLVAWLANQSPKKLGWLFVAEIYDALDKIGMGGRIPIDNYKRVDRIYGLRKSKLAASYQQQEADAQTRRRR